VVELGGRQDDIRRPQSQNRAGVELLTAEHVVLKVHDTFRRAGAAGGEEPEGGVVASRRRDPCLRVRGGQRGRPILLARAARSDQKHVAQERHLDAAFA